MLPKNLPIAILGIPIDNLTLQESVQKFQTLIERYKQDLRPRYIATLNVDFLVNTYPVSLQGSKRPELLNALQKGSLVTLDGMPLVWLASLLGNPVQERVTGVELLSSLVTSLAEKKQKLYLLGADEKILKLAMLYLEDENPHLKIVGAAHPSIPIEGEDLETAIERDYLIVEKINQASPDLLVLALGNPKQEIWFERIHHQLRVPVTLGIGGALKILTEVIPRAPRWMQKFGLEWLFRLFQEPKRLFSRYFKDLIKFPFMVLPLFLYHSLNWAIYQIFYNTRSKIKWRMPLLFISEHQTLVVIPLPERLDSLFCRELWMKEEDFFAQDAIVFDFKKVRHIDLEGFALLIKMEKRAEREKKSLFALSISADIRLLLRLHRVWDLMKNQTFESPDAILRLLKRNGKPNHFTAIQQDAKHVVISFFGNLDNTLDYDFYLRKLKQVFYQKFCILDFSYCSTIESRGISFLLKVQKNVDKTLVSLKICGLSNNLRKQLRLAKVYHLFEEGGSLETLLES